MTSTKGKLKVLHEHYQHLGKMSVDSDFDDDWKEMIEKRVGNYNNNNVRYV